MNNSRSVYYLLVLGRKKFAYGNKHTLCVLRSKKKLLFKVLCDTELYMRMDKRDNLGMMEQTYLMCTEK